MHYLSEHVQCLEHMINSLLFSQNRCQWLTVLFTTIWNFLTAIKPFIVTLCLHNIVTSSETGPNWRKISWICVSRVDRKLLVVVNTSNCILASFFLNDPGFRPVSSQYPFNFEKATYKFSWIFSRWLINRVLWRNS